MGSTAKAAGWPRLAGAQGSHRHELALIEASGAPAGRRPCQPLAVHHVRAAGATPRAASAGLGGGRRGSWPGRTPTPRAARRRRPLSSTTRWLPWPGGCVAGDWASGSCAAQIPRAVLARNLEITYGTTALDARRAVSLLPSQYSMCICINAPKGCQHGTHTIWTACPLETSRVSKAKPPATRVCESEVIDLACRLTILNWQISSSFFSK